MKEVNLTQGYTALVDDQDYLRVSQYKWCVLFRRDKDGSILSVYARTNAHIGSQLMHRFILGVTDSKVEVDHEDHNGLNCRRYNLRKATKAQNQHNQKLHIRNKSGFKGVRWQEPSWLSYIRYQGKQLHLGSFSNILDAARAYNEAAKKYFGEFALLNIVP